ncbi:MAG: radical SAM/SPASM domain-containing protein [Thermodesulfobacteriota bacterium]
MNNTNANTFPDRVTIELTNNCNLKCIMCPRVYMKSPRGFILMSLFKKIIDEMSMHNNNALVPFFRGESLLHPEFIGMMKYVKAKKISPVQLTTNATLMTENIAQTLIDIELDFISFSIDSIDPHEYSKIRKGADLQKVLRNIENFCKIRREKGHDKPEIQVSVVKTENTADGLDDFIEFWQDRVDRVRVYEEHSRNGSYGSIRRDCEAAAPTEERKPCLKPFSDLVIYWNGSVALCNHDWDRTDAIGNVNASSIEEIWHNRKYKIIREAHIHDRDLLEELCKKCDHWETHYLPHKQIGDLYASNSKTAINIY